MGYKFTIDTRNTKPIYFPLRTFSLKEQEEHDKQVEEMVQKHIITRTRSLWSAPVLLVKKNDNSYRVVVDLTRLNEKTEDDNFPLTTPRSTFGTLCSARYYSSLDFESGYLGGRSQQEGCSKSNIQHKKRDICIFKNANGIEKGGSAAFQRFMTEIFVDLMNQGVLVFIDNILIYSEKWEQHLKLVNEVLKCLAEHDLQEKVGE